MDKQKLFEELMEQVEVFGELPRTYEGLTLVNYLGLLTEENKRELSDAIDNYAEAAYESMVNNFYGSSEPVTVEEIHKKAFDTKQKLR